MTRPRGVVRSWYLVGHEPGSPGEGEDRSPSPRRCWSPAADAIREGHGQTVPGRDQPRHPGLDPGLGPVPGRPGSPRVTQPGATTRTASPPSPRRRPASLGTTPTSRWRTPSAPRCCASGAGTPSGSARTTTSRSTPGRWARPRRTGRSGMASTASTGSSAARPTSGIPTWSRTTTTPTSRTRPRRATTSQGPGGQGDRLHPRLRPGRRPAVAGQPPAAGGRPALTQQRSSPGRPMSGHWPPGGMAGGRRTDDFSRPWGLSCDAEVHVQTAAMPLDPGDLAFAVVLAADLKRQAALRPRKRLECREERSPRPCTQLSVPWTSLRPWTSS